MKAGIMVDALSMSQQSFNIIKELNKLSKIDRYIDVILFYHRYDRYPVTPYFAMLQEQEVWGFDGPIIATNILSVERLIKCPSPKDKYFYIWDLEWIYNPYFKYKYLRSIYQNESIKLIARSESHLNIIEKCWKKPVGILEDFNHEQLIKIFDRSS